MATTTTNEALTIIPVPGVGAEDVLVTPDGRVWTGTVDGAIFAIEPDGSRITRVATTPGRPLGLEALPHGRILVCDAHAGLIAVDPATGRTETLLSEVEGRPMVFCNNAAVHSDGSIYFSDSSRHHPIERWKADMIEDTRSGRLMRLTPQGEVEVLIDGLRFANGVALSQAEDYVCVAETTARTVVRHWLTGPNAGRTDRLAEDLPGYPDNIARGSDGLIWVTIASPIDPLLARLHRIPMALRTAVWKLPEAVQPQPKRTVRVLAFDDAGTRVHDRSGDASGFHMVTGVREHDGRVWLGSLVEPAVAWFAR